MNKTTFISYASSDLNAARQIVQYLEDQKIFCFFSERDIITGTVWSSEISKAISNSKCMIVLFSKAYDNSPHVDREIDIASNEHIPIIPVRLDDTPYSGAKKYYLANLQWIDLYPDFDLSIERIVKAVYNCLSFGYCLKTPDNPIVPRRRNLNSDCHRKLNS